MAAGMAREALLDTLIEDRRQRLAQRVERRDGRGVMILAVVVIAREQFQIQIPDGIGVSAGVEPLHGARRYGERRQSRRTAQSFLGATVSDVDSRGVDADRNGNERRDAIRE